MPAWRVFDAPHAEASARPSAGPWAADFRAHVGTTFRLRGTNDILRLIEVSEHAPHSGVEQFSAIFSASAAAIDDGIYTLVHPALGRQDLFIARVGAPHALRYEACFSRPVDVRMRA